MIKFISDFLSVMAVVALFASGLLIAIKFYRYAFVAIAMMLSTGFLSTWIDDPDGKKHFAKEADEKIQREALEHQAAQADAQTAEIKRLLNSGASTSPILTLKNSKDGKDISMRCSQIGDITNCKPVGQ